MQKLLFVQGNRLEGVTNDILFPDELTIVRLLFVFSKCFRAGFYTFSWLKLKVNKGTNSCNLCFKIKTKTYLVDLFISMVTIHSACHC